MKENIESKLNWIFQRLSKAVLISIVDYQEKRISNNKNIARKASIELYARFSDIVLCHQLLERKTLRYLFRYLPIVQNRRIAIRLEIVSESSSSYSWGISMNFKITINPPDPTENARLVQENTYLPVSHGDGKDKLTLFWTRSLRLPFLRYGRNRQFVDVGGIYEVGITD